MGVFGRSLTGDAVDRHSHTWAVLFLVLLSLVTWLLPLSRLNQPSDARMRGKNGQHPGSSSTKFKAECWCPRQFQARHIEYTNRVCGAAFNFAMQGLDPESQSIGVGLTSQPLVPGASEEPVHTLVDRVGAERIRRLKRAESAWRFILVSTPFFLFLLAVALKASQMLCSLLSGLAGGLNVKQTLAAAETGARLDHASRQQLLRDLARAAADSVRSRTWPVASVLYLLLKVLTCVVVTGELLVVHGVLLPRAAALGNDLSATLADTTLDSPALLFCNFKIRQWTNVHEYTVQCLFSREDAASSSKALGGQWRQQRPYQPKLHEMYKTLYLVLQTYLLVLCLANVLSLVTWVARLAGGPCRRQVSGSGPSLPMDAALLLHTARENAGPEVARAIAQNGQWAAAAAGTAGEGIPLQEKGGRDEGAAVLI